MWCDACRSVGMIHCAHPSECGNMLSDSAAADNWKAWLDDLPLGAEFQPAVDRLQDFISGLSMSVATLTPTAVDASHTPDPAVNAPDPAAIWRCCECGMSMPCMADPCKHPFIQKEPPNDRA